MKDYSGAADQHIELINNFPRIRPGHRSRSLLLRYQRQQQLVDFTLNNHPMPRDYRWPMFGPPSSLEQYPAAIESYAKAIIIRRIS
jgi:hypothetical protein